MDKPPAAAPITRSSGRKLLVVLPLFLIQLRPDIIFVRTTSMYDRCNGVALTSELLHLAHAFAVTIEIAISAIIDIRL